MKRIVLMAAVAGLAACGDPATEDARGYTKAPLEAPGLLVAGEEATPMDELGTPNRPRLPAEGRADAEPAAAPGQTGGDAADSGAESGATLAAGVTQAQFDEGEELFGGTGGCMACHGQGGTGGMLGPDLTDAQWLHVAVPEVAAIATVITDGVSDPKEHPGPMPAMGGANLTEEEVEALAGYVASISGG